MSICYQCHAEGLPQTLPCKHDEQWAKLAVEGENPTRHEYPPVWDETLKAWINNPPWGKPGQGAKQ